MAVQTNTLVAPADRKVGETATFKELGGYINGDLAGINDGRLSKLDIDPVLAAILFIRELAAVGHNGAIPAVVLVPNNGSHKASAATSEEVWANILDDGGTATLEEDSTFVRIK